MEAKDVGRLLGIQCPFVVEVVFLYQDYIVG